MAFISGSDEYGKIDIVLFPNVYKTCFGIKKGDIIKVTGRVERRMSSYQFGDMSIDDLDTKKGKDAMSTLFKKQLKMKK